MDIRFKSYTDCTNPRKKLGQAFHIRLSVDTTDFDEWQELEQAIRKAIAQPAEIEEKKPVLGFHQEEEEETEES